MERNFSPGIPYRSIVAIRRGRPETVLREWTFADAAVEYIQLQDRIKRAIDASKIGEKIIPAKYVDWATDSNIPLANELKQAVEAQNKITDWKARYDDLLRQRNAIAAERDGLESELSQMKAKAGRDTLILKEPKIVKRLIIGMAVTKYNYDPKPLRSAVTQKIFDDLERLGILRRPGHYSQLAARIGGGTSAGLGTRKSQLTEFGLALHLGHRIRPIAGF